ncbi:MAG: hypothetical protein RLZZ399_1592 [Verrucomicrobiota bacterium]
MGPPVRACVFAFVRTGCARVQRVGPRGLGPLSFPEGRRVFPGRPKSGIVRVWARPKAPVEG